MSGWQPSGKGNKAAVQELHEAHPDWGATAIAHALGCTDGYVRCTVKRLGIKLPRSKYAAVPTQGADYRRQQRAQANHLPNPSPKGGEAI